MLDERHTASFEDDRPPFLQRLAKSRWSPIEVLSDDQYAGILSERLLAVEAEIAIIDEKIEKLNAKPSSTTEPDTLNHRPS